jgi:hypothetical protein
MRFTKSVISLLGALLLIGVSATLSAAQEGQGWQDAPWRFSFDIYGWLPNAPATIKIDGHEVANMPESFDNILDSLEMAAMLRFDARKGPLGLFVSPIYYDGDYSEHFTGPLGQRRKFELKETVWFIDYGASYEIGRWDIGAEPDSGTVTLAPYAGFRFLHDKIRINVDPGLLDDGVRVRKTISTNAPIVGLDASWQLTPSWTLRVHGDYGGFNVDGMQETYQAVGTLTYHFQWGKLASKAYAGYRYVHLEYEDEPLDIKVAVRGPLVGIGFDF